MSCVCDFIKTNLTKPDQHPWPMLLKHNSSTCETVAHPGYCLNELWVKWVVVQFMAEPKHMHVYRTRALHILAAPYLLQQRLACQNITAMANEIDVHLNHFLHSAFLIYFSLSAPSW